MGNIYCISDLHMGDCGFRDNFRGRENALLTFLDMICKEKGMLYILGDMYEFWQCSVSQAINPSMTEEDRKKRDQAGDDEDDPVKRAAIKEAAQKAFRAKEDCVKLRLRLFDKLEQMSVDGQVQYIYGNHDIDLKQFCGDGWFCKEFLRQMKGHDELIVNGQKFLLKHGHDVDEDCASETPGAGRWITLFGGMVEEIARTPVLSSGATVEDTLVEVGEKYKLEFISFYLKYRGKAWIVRKVMAVGQAISSTWHYIRRKIFGSTDVIKTELGKRLPAIVGSTAEDREELYPSIAAAIDTVLSRRSVDIPRMKKLLLKQKESGGYLKVVIGHTHVPELADGWYCNTGSWVKTEKTADNGKLPINDYLVIYEDASVKLKRWE